MCRKYTFFWYWMVLDGIGWYWFHGKIMDSSQQNGSLCGRAAPSLAYQVLRGSSTDLRFVGCLPHLTSPIDIYIYIILYIIYIIYIYILYILYIYYIIYILYIIYIYSSSIHPIFSLVPTNLPIINRLFGSSAFLIQSPFFSSINCCVPILPFFDASIHMDW